MGLRFFFLKDAYEGGTVAKKSPLDFSFFSDRLTGFTDFFLRGCSREFNFKRPERKILSPISYAS